MNKEGELRKVALVNSDWLLSCYIDGLDVIIPECLVEEFGNGPVSKANLMKYMKDNEYYNG